MSPTPGDPEETELTIANLDDFKRSFLDNLASRQGKHLRYATPLDCYMALAHTVRKHLLHDWLQTTLRYLTSDVKIVYYFSAEYLLGRQLGNALLNAGLTEMARQAMADLGLDLDGLSELEVEPGLGNGGLGRLAACFLDLLATLDVPAVGYGIRYEYGIFRQTFHDGWQVEQADDWLRWGDPWEFAHTDHAVVVGFGGRTEAYADEDGRYRVRWLAGESVLGIPYNLMIPGYRNGTVNTLRLWSARATETFDLKVFNTGDYIRAVEKNTACENISKVLYPDDTTRQGKELRLKQQYFFVACSLKDILTRFLAHYGHAWDRFPDLRTIQLNDTHPTIAIAELMRLLVDEHRLDWERAWAITGRSFGYTVHTLMPEALEEWPVDIFAGLLPRHLEIVYEINRRFLDQVAARFPGDPDRLIRMSIIRETPERRVRMAYLASVGSHAINGVAELQSELLKRLTLRDFAELWPAKFGNKTNGVTPRRFLRLVNPRLSELISATIGDGWVADLDRLRALEPHADDPAFRAAWRAVKQANKEALAGQIRLLTGVTVDPASLFDVMVKRLHEYKRQLLNALHVITLYHRIKDDPGLTMTPRVVIFGAKAAPGYAMAKLIIKLINSVAAVVNHDPVVGDRLKVVFLPNYNVSLAERIIPAADLSEQISLAGKEASGTGNMKLALNGAPTIGTLDGANIEIRALVGPENFFLFGLTTEQMFALKADGYNPRDYYEADPELKRAIDSIGEGEFSGGDPNRFGPLVYALLYDDQYLLCADYRSYIDRQDEAARAYRDAEGWTRASILNSARCGYFSSDRTIRQYCEEIWRVGPAVVRQRAAEAAGGAGG